MYIFTTVCIVKIAKLRLQDAFGSILRRMATIRLI